MNPFAIEVKGLKKAYALSGVGGSSGGRSIRDQLTARARRFFKHEQGVQKSEGESYFWALKGIDFSIERGSVVGVIGGNGAGKSTLLKVLSRITEPTEGRITLRGRVSSMLEVGTGFHPELSGRENIFLNGTILGMKYAEIREHFDEIVAFSGVEKFIDLPLKRYSSGMGLRLAFSVAAHLNSEILIVDEILAVGDAEFQNRCIGKMKSITKSGDRTVLFVSHNMSVIQTLCERTLMLKRGELVADGTPSVVIQKYLQFGGTTNLFERKEAEDGRPTFVRGKLDCDQSDGVWRVWADVEIKTKVPLSVAFHFALRDATGIPVAYGSLGLLNDREIALKTGVNKVRVGIDTRGLAMGGYWITISLVKIESVDIQLQDHLENIFFFEHMPNPEPGELKVIDQAWGVGSVRLQLLRE